MFDLTPKQEQACEILSSDAREILLYGGSRAAKTFLIIYAIIIRACKCKSRHIVLRQRFNQCKQSIVYETWPKVIELAFPQLQNRLILNKQDWFVKFPNGSEVWFAGLDDKIRTEKVLGREASTMFFNEASQMQYSSYIMALTRLAEKNELKKKSLIDENPPYKGHWTYKKFIEFVDPKSGQPLDKDKVASMLMNPVDNIENLDKEYIKLLESLPELDRNRFLHGVFNDTIEGGVYTKELIRAEVDKRISDVKAIEGYPINAVFDIGVSDDTAIWFAQFLKDKILLLDYYSDNRLSLPEYLNIIYGVKGLKIGTMYLPHDARNKSWGTGRSNREIAEEYGKKLDFKIEILPRLSLWDGVSCARVLFDKCHFDKTKCLDGLEALRNYKIDFNEKLGKYNDEPTHDWASHGADAFRYLCMAYDELHIRAPQISKEKKEGQCPRQSPEGYTFDDILKENIRERRRLERLYR